MSDTWPQQCIDRIRREIAFERRRTDEPLKVFAKRIGIGYSTLSRFENGKAIDLISFLNICHFLGLRIE